MRVGAYNPYLHTRGGGERYFLDGCLALAKRHEVTVLVPEGPRTHDELTAQLTALLGTDLSPLRFVPLGPGEAPQRALNRFDATFSVTNDRPLMGVPHPHVAVLQFPFGITRWRLRRRLRAAIAMARCDRLLVYSNYVRRWANTIPGARPLVVAPGVTPVPANRRPKEPIILAVGRFTASGHNKKHGALIDAFSDVVKSLPDWRLAMVGALGDGDRDYLDSLRERAAGLQVQFFPNAERGELELLYRRASLFWHGAGLGVDAQRNPELMEHFGIVAVEAMSAGAVPLVFNGGGLPEIVVDGECGLLWSTPDELVRLTVELAKDDATRQAMAGRARERARLFSAETFVKGFEDVLPDAMR